MPYIPTEHCGKDEFGNSLLPQRDQRFRTKIHRGSALPNRIEDRAFGDAMGRQPKDFRVGEYPADDRDLLGLDGLCRRHGVADDQNQYRQNRGHVSGHVVSLLLVRRAQRPHDLKNGAGPRNFSAQLKEGYPF
jgi:hypothetical protein